MSRRVSPVADYVWSVRDRTAGWVTAWLLLLFAVQVITFVLVWRYFVHTVDGQSLDRIAYRGHTIGQWRIDRPVRSALKAISILSLISVTAVIGFIAVARARLMLAVVSMSMIVGANVTTQLLKHGLVRPDLGREAIPYNSLPSGHTTVGVSVVIAAVLVLPPRLRPAAALGGAGYAAFIGVATVAAGWHRPSDAVAGLLVVGGWAAAAGIVLVVAGWRGEVAGWRGPAAGADRRSAGGPVAGSDPRSPVGPVMPAAVEASGAHVGAVAALLGTGLALLAIGLFGLWLTSEVVSVPLTELSRRWQFVAYGTSAAGIAGTAGLVMAGVLATVHLVVPQRLVRPIPVAKGAAAGVGGATVPSAFRWGGARRG